MDNQDRNLPASQRKLTQARNDGQASRSKDLSHMVVLGAGAAALWVMTPSLVQHLKQALIQQLTFNAVTLLQPATMLDQLQHMTAIAVGASLLFAAVIACAAIAGEVASGGWVMSFKPMMPT